MHDEAIDLVLHAVNIPEALAALGLRVQVLSDESRLDLPALEPLTSVLEAFMHRSQLILHETLQVRLDGGRHGRQIAFELSEVTLPARIHHLFSDPSIGENLKKVAEGHKIIFDGGRQPC